MKLKFIIKHLFIPQNCQILAKTFRLKMLNIGGAQK